MHILITGGAGFIGSNLVEYHLAKGDQVHIVDNLSTGTASNMAAFVNNPDLRFDQADVLTWPGLEKAAVWADRIYHLAAVVGIFKVLEDPIKVLATNVAGCERVLRAAHAGNWNPQVLLASTSEVYGTGVSAQQLAAGESAGKFIDHTSIPAFLEDMDPMVGSSTVSRWNYSISKLTDEAFGISYARAHKMRVCVVRFFNTVGPRQTGRYGMVLPRFVRQALAGQPMTVYGDGTQSRCFCDVRDTVAALDKLLTNPECYAQIVNVGNSREISIKALAELVKARAKSASPIKFVAYKDAYAEVFQETVRRRPNLEKFNRLTGFKHKWSLEQTIDDLIAHEKNKQPA